MLLGVYMNLKDSIVLVTGGAGHIASHIVDELLQKNVSKVIVVDNLSSGRLSNLENHLDNPRLEIVREDIRDYENLLDIMYGVDYVFHAAGVLLLECRDYPIKGLEVNINGTYNIIKAAIKTGVRKIIFSTSGSVYGDPSYLPMDEEHQLNSETVYGTTKI